MHIFIEENINNIEKRIKEFDQFCDDCKSNLTTHRYQLLVCWYKHFYSKNNNDFGKHRGRNFIGTRSWLLKPQFIVAEKDGALQAIVPLFLFKIYIRQEKQDFFMLSFCPDSSLIFYQDFLVNHQNRTDINQTIFRFLEKYLIKNDYSLFLGHVPEGSPNLDSLIEYTKQSLSKGFEGGFTRIKWRGGVYPWNFERLDKVLQKLERSLPLTAADLHGDIAAMRNEIASQTSSILFFEKSRQRIETNLKELIQECNKYSDISQIEQKVSDVFKSVPIVYPYLKLPKSEPDFYASLSKSKRYYYRRYLNKFLTAGGEVEIVEPPDLNSKDIQKYIELHLERWGDESAAIINATIPFHLDMSKAMAQLGYFRLFFMKFNSERIAVLSCFDLQDRREFYYSGRTLDNSKLRAGKLLVLFSILDAIQKGLRYYDFGYGGDAYKFEFTKTYRTLYGFFLSRNPKKMDFQKLFPLYEEIAF
jgi:hypothetical protein